MRFVALLVLAVPSVALAHGPPIPKEVLVACDGKASGAPCTVKLHEKEFHGTCAALPDGKLACRPKKS